MKKLFEQFEQLSTHAQGLLLQGIQQMKSGYAPDNALCHDITSALASLRSIYDDIRRKLPECLIAEEMPNGDLSIREYEEAWQNSIVKRNNAVRNVLEEFIRVYSHEKKYMDAIESYILDAKELLDGINSCGASKQTLDVSLYQLFLEGVKADLSTDEELSDRIWESASFSKTIIRGLTEDKYHIRSIEVTDGLVEESLVEDVDKETKPEIVIVGDAADLKVDNEADTLKVHSSNRGTDDEITATLIRDEFTEKSTLDESEIQAEGETISEPANEQPIDNEIESLEEFIHPINPIKYAKLPSEQKLRELIKRTGSVLGFLIDKLTFVGLMDETRVFNALTQKHKPLSREQCIEAFAVLERKGMLCTYEFEGRNILCFTQLMESCLQKASLASTLKRLLNLKKIGRVHITGVQNMPLGQFVHHMMLVDQYNLAIDMLTEDEESAKKLETSTWHHEGRYFLMHLSLEDGSRLPLRIIELDAFTEFIPVEGEGLLCCADELPDMRRVEDQIHYCLTPKGFFHWSGSQWIAITHIDDLESVTDLSAQDETNVDDSTVFDSLPEESSRETTAVEDIVTTREPIASIKQLVTTTEQSEELWLDDLSTESKFESEVEFGKFANMTSVEIARQLLNTANNGNTPSDESMAVLIHQLLTEGVRSYDVHNLKDQLVEAIVLAKLLSSSDSFPRCRNIYYQLHAAIPFIRENGANTGAVLTNVFAEETEYTPVAKLCAYVYGMLFPAHAHDHTFAALYNNAFMDYESQFPGFDILKPLYHKAMEGLRLVPTAFSPANLAALSDSRLQQERMDSIRARATELLKPPTVKVMIRGVPELIDICFGNQTDLHNALEIVSDNDLGMREFVEVEVAKYCKDDEIDSSSLERLLDSQWSVAAQKYSSRRMGIKYDARKHLLNALMERLIVLREWLEETDTDTAPNVEKLRVVRNEVLRIIEESIEEIKKSPYTAALGIIRASLELIRARLQNQGSGISFSTMLRSGVLVIDQNELILNDDLNEIEYAEPWRMMLQHITCTDYDLKNVYDRILNADPRSILYDNIGQLVAIGRLIGADPKEYEISCDGLRDAINSANLQAQNFREKLEISYAYNRISENDRERLAMLADPEASEFQKFFYDHKAFGCWRGFLNALCDQIRKVAQQSMQDVRSQLDQAKAMLRPSEKSPILDQAERLITQEQNYAVAEDYIHRFRNGERELPFETNDGAISHYLDFISDDIFTGLYSFCERRKESSLPKLAAQYIENNRPEGWTTRHFEDAQRFIEKWPIGKQAVNPQNIQEFFRQLGLNVESCTKATRCNEVCCTLTVNKSEQNQADYRHPISMFGTQMKRQIEVVCLFGKRTAKQLIDDVCNLGITSTFIVLLDATLSSSDRRMMAQYFFTQKNVGQASFLVIDRVLALYLAMQSSNERLPAMLQCTLPYTIYQPFTNGSGSTADEMFFGRVNELSSIRDMTGASIVYGGRQLGKTALLERAKHLDNNPDRRDFAVMTSFKECRGEQDFLEILVSTCNDTFEKSGIKLNPCTSIRDFTSQIRRLLENDSISTLRLLLDEMDDFLDSISASNYIEILPLIELQRGSNRRFKFVLAGLHNVCRAKNATRNNGLFGQLGSPLCVKPLTAADARNLLVRPLRYLGFRVSHESHIDTILTNTNYYPGIIQFFGYTLIQTLASQYTHYYNAVNGNPPFELHDDQLASIMNSRDLNQNIKERLRWTLEMDNRYFMLARCITVLYHLSSNDYSMISNGFDVSSIREIANDMFCIHCLASLTEQETVTLLDEMEEMGILSRPNSQGNRYLLRRRSFIDVIGTNLDVLEHDIELYNKEAGNNA